MHLHVSFHRRQRHSERPHDVLLPHRLENTSTLVTVGAYRLIRHPLYASLLALVSCAYLKNPLAIAGIVLALGASSFLVATSIAEESENLMGFGAAYAAYMKRTRRFIPFLF